MPQQAPYIQTLASAVAHDLGEMAHRTGRSPQARDAQRFAASRASELGLPSADATLAGNVAIRDWRATQRSHKLAEGQTLAQSYVQGRGTIQTIGVRVVLDVEYRGRTPPGMPRQVSVLVNAAAGETPADAINRALTAFNSRQLLLPRGPAYRNATARTGKIVQLVEGGWSHAQM